MKLLEILKELDINRVSDIGFNKAKEIAQKIGVDFGKISIGEFYKGISDEYKKHGDVVKGNLEMAGKIAFSHLKKNPEYYTKLSSLGLD